MLYGPSNAKSFRLGVRAHSLILPDIKAQSQYGIQIYSNQIACMLIPNQRNEEKNQKSSHQKSIKSHLRILASSRQTIAHS